MPDAFVFTMLTAERFPVVVGGFCHNGRGTSMERVLSACVGNPFGLFSDPYLVDRMLVRMLREAADMHRNTFADCGVSVIAAAIKTPMAEKPCGAVIGDVFAEPESACEKEGPVPIQADRHSFYTLSYPGKLGLALQCGYDTALAIDAVLRKTCRTLAADAMARQAEQALRENSSAWLLVSDSSGGTAPRESLVMKAENGAWRVSL